MEIGLDYVIIFIQFRHLVRLNKGRFLHLSYINLQIFWLNKTGTNQQYKFKTIYLRSIGRPHVGITSEPFCHTIHLFRSRDRNSTTVQTEGMYAY